MPVPDFSPGEVLTADAMDSIGLWLVGSTTVTAQTTGIVDNCFTDNYRNYQVVVSVTAGTINQELKAQFRIGGAPTATNYNWQAFGVLGAAFNANAVAADTSFPITFVPDPANNATSFFIGLPKVAARTSFAGDWLYDDGGTRIARRVMGRQSSLTAFDGIQIFSAANWTGNIRVYGLRD